ncbi:MAG: hypothetical protein IPK98_09545 [Chloracidobacterium sp.]|nr:hypothetical protein [Chloracidobacterium sp.]
MDRSHQVQREKANGTCVGKYGDALAVVFVDDIVQLSRDAAEQVAIALALGDDVVDAAVDEGVVVFWMTFF